MNASAANQKHTQEPLLGGEEAVNDPAGRTPRGSGYIPESQRYSIKFDFLSEANKPEEGEQPFPWKKVYILGGVFLGFLLVLFIVYKAYGVEIFAYLYSRLQDLAQDASFGNTLVLILCQFAYGWILFFPGISTFNIMQAFLMKSFWRPFLLSTIGGYLASLSVFYIIKNHFRMKVVEQFKDKVVFAIVYLAVKRNPVRMGVLVNFLFLPPSVRNYLCALTSIPFQQYCYAVLPGHLTYCFMFSLVGYTMTDLNSFFHDKPFSEKSFAEKLQKILTYFMLLLTLGIMIFFGYLAFDSVYQSTQNYILPLFSGIRTLAKKMYSEFEENLKRDGEHLKIMREREMKKLEQQGSPVHHNHKIDVLV